MTVRLVGSMAELVEQGIRALDKDHTVDATVMLPRDVAESLRDYLAQKQAASGMETHRAEADGMDDEYAALCEALKEGT